MKYYFFGNSRLLVDILSFLTHAKKRAKNLVQGDDLELPSFEDK